MNKTIALGLAGLMTIGASTAASAGEAMQDAKIYASAHISHNYYDLPAGNNADDDSVWGFGILAGVEFDAGHNGLTISPEGGWQNLGELEEANGGPGRLEFTGFTAGLRAAYPICNDGQTRLIARAGRIWWNAEDESSQEVDGQDWYYGGGADHQLTDQLRIGADVQYQSIDIQGIDLDVYTAALRTTFTF